MIGSSIDGGIATSQVKEKQSIDFVSIDCKGTETTLSSCTMKETQCKEKLKQASVICLDYGNDFILHNHIVLFDLLPLLFELMYRKNEHILPEYTFRQDEVGHELALV